MNTREGWDERTKAGRGDCRGKGGGVTHHSAVRDFKI